jgi:uncharacterized protein (DUF433 family)
MEDEVEIQKTSAWRNGSPLVLAPGIVADKNIRFGQPTIKGRRVDVLTVLGQLAAGVTLEGLAEGWALEMNQIADVLDYTAGVIDSETVIAASN